MTTSVQTASTSLERANLFLRTKQWGEALEAYYELLSKNHPLERQLAWNLSYLVTKAPNTEISPELRRKASKILNKKGYACELKNFDTELHGRENDTESILEEYLANDIKKKNWKKKPDERLVLKLAIEIANDVGYDAACLYANRYLPERLNYTLHVLQANAALERRNENAWLSHINLFLRKFGLQPLRLRKGPSLLARLSSATLPIVTNGPLVTVIMSAWNAQDTVEFAALSILNQTWAPIELIIFDDASQDNTWSVLKKLSTLDERVRIYRNKKNVGSYVSKNLALNLAKGDYVTGHDADDWALPQRIELHLAEILALGRGNLKASLNYMLRMDSNGTIVKISRSDTPSCLDGAARLSSISCMFEANALRNKLGFWDSVRFAADSEMIARAAYVFGDGFQTFRQIGMLCLDHADSLTNHPIHGVAVNGGGMAESRASYRDSWQKWHVENLHNRGAYLPFPQKVRRYKANSEMIVNCTELSESIIFRKVSQTRGLDQ